LPSACAGFVRQRGLRISRGHLYWILSNPIYVGRLEGRLPRGFCIMRLTDRPMLWSEQWRATGLQAPVQVGAELG